MIRIKRVYERPETDDGYRVLVDRLWPRGISKERAGVDEWLKEAGPSDDLRRWFRDNPEEWEDFKASYVEELRTKGTLLDKITSKSEKARVTLLYAYKDPEHNQAVVLKEFLEETKGRPILAA
jgi:uncharacterized protein YeaO (DUF488 family)